MSNTLKVREPISNNTYNLKDTENHLTITLNNSYSYLYNLQKSVIDYEERFYTTRNITNKSEYGDLYIDVKGRVCIDVDIELIPTHLRKEYLLKKNTEEYIFGKELTISYMNENRHTFPRIPIVIMDNKTLYDYKIIIHNDYFTVITNQTRGFIQSWHADTDTYQFNDHNFQVYVSSNTFFEDIEPDDIGNISISDFNNITDINQTEGTIFAVVYTKNDKENVNVKRPLSPIRKLSNDKIEIITDYNFMPGSIYTVRFIYNKYLHRYHNYRENGNVLCRYYSYKEYVSEILEKDSPRSEIFLIQKSENDTYNMPVPKENLLMFKKKGDVIKGYSNKNIKLSYPNLYQGYEVDDGDELIVYYFYKESHKDFKYRPMYKFYMDYLKKKWSLLSLEEIINTIYFGSMNIVDNIHINYNDLVSYGTYTNAILMEEGSIISPSEVDNFYNYSYPLNLEGDLTLDNVYASFRNVVNFRDFTGVVPKSIKEFYEIFNKIIHMKIDEFAYDDIDYSDNSFIDIDGATSVVIDPTTYKINKFKEFISKDSEAIRRYVVENDKSHIQYQTSIKDICKYTKPIRINRIFDGDIPSGAIEYDEYVISNYNPNTDTFKFSFKAYSNNKDSSYRIFVDGIYVPQSYYYIHGFAEHVNVYAEILDPYRKITTDTGVEYMEGLPGEWGPHITEQTTDAYGNLVIRTKEYIEPAEINLPMNIQYITKEIVFSSINNVIDVEVFPDYHFKTKLELSENNPSVIIDFDDGFNITPTVSDIEIIDGEENSYNLSLFNLYKIDIINNIKNKILTEEEYNELIVSEPEGLSIDYNTMTGTSIKYIIIEHPFTGECTYYQKKDNVLVEKIEYGEGTSYESVGTLEPTINDRNIRHTELHKLCIEIKDPSILVSGEFNGYLIVRKDSIIEYSYNETPYESDYPIITLDYTPYYSGNIEDHIRVFKNGKLQPKNTYHAYKEKDECNIDYTDMWNDNNIFIKHGVDVANVTTNHPTEHDGVPDYASCYNVFKDDNSVWVSGFIDNPSNKITFTIELSDKTNITNFAIKWIPSIYSRSMKIQSSDNGIEWIDVGTYNTTPNQNNLTVINLNDSIVTKYINIIMDNYSASMVGIEKLCLYDYGEITKIQMLQHIDPNDSLCCDITPYSHKLIYFDKELDSTIVDLRRYINKPFDLRYYEVYLNGRKLNKTQIFPISESAFKLCNITSKFNLEIYERDRDWEYYGCNFDDYFTLSDLFIKSFMDNETMRAILKDIYGVVFTSEDTELPQMWERDVDENTYTFDAFYYLRLILLGQTSEDNYEFNNDDITEQFPMIYEHCIEHDRYDEEVILLSPDNIIEGEDKDRTNVYMLGNDDRYMDKN